MGRSKGVMTGDSLRPVIVTCVRRTENRANLASNCRNGAGIAEAGWEVGDLSWGRFGGWLRCSNIYGGRRWGISREAALETFCNIRRVPK